MVSNRNIKYVNARQQCVGIFAKALTDRDMRKALMSIIGLFDMNHQKLVNNSAHKSWLAMPSRDVRISVEMQQSGDE